MLRLTDIVKTYKTGDTCVQALRGVCIAFRQNEFVSVLGPSGCGKTTLLNIIGGLDRYDTGDLSVSGRSTKQFRDSDWDSYRNHSVGFVFQNYNLIPHQTVLSNVELALTLSGVSKSARRKRAAEALEKVGLGDQLAKKPNQLSGGQMQRVAIARALVNDPEILLADEPTGALDSETSVQIMELLKEIAQDRLVVMVTHNPDLAAQYSTRIVRLLDGQIIDDTDPYTEEIPPEETRSRQEIRAAKKTAKKTRRQSRTSMSFRTALTLSLNNLLTKKGRTFMTSFAGSIGIIGIALILSLSNGFQLYIDTVQQDALSAYPLSIQKETIDLTSMLESFAKHGEKSEHERDKVYSNPVMTSMMHTFTSQVTTNDLASFKMFIEDPDNGVTELLSAPPRYSYNFDLNIYKSDVDAGVVQLSPTNVLTDLMGGSMGGSTDGMNSFSSMSSMSSMGAMGGMSTWVEILDNRALLDTQYEIVDGKWPESFDEVVLVTDQNNEITDIALYAVGLLDQEELLNTVSAIMNGQDVEPQAHSFTYQEILDTTFTLVLPADYYVRNEETGLWDDMRYDDAYMEALIRNGLPLRIVGIVRPGEEATATSITGTIGYTHALTDYIVAETDKREIVQQQRENPDTDVFTGLTFKDVEEKQALAARTQTAPAEEETTTAPAAENVSVSLPKATVGTLAWSSPAALRHVATTMTEEEIYAYIDENTPDDQKEAVKDFVRLALKNTRTLSERKRMAEYLNAMPTDASLPTGGQKLTADQLNAYLLMMTKEQKLAVITAMITGDTSALESVLPKELLERASQAETAPDTTAPAAEESTTRTETDSEAETERPDDVSEPETDEAETQPPVPAVPQIQAADSLSVNRKLLGMTDLDDPDAIHLYPVDFAAKEKLSQLIEEYNQSMRDAGHEDGVIEYTDYLGIFLSSVTTIINVVSYVLIAFVAISLVVSSIMIGIITYISVLERTKEIGILRSIGASKRDISRVFNAETLIVGLAAGLIGIGVTLLLNIPVNLLIKALVHISNVSRLPVGGAIALIVISVLLTVVAGLIPSRYAAKKDPVEALRTE